MVTPKKALRFCAVLSAVLVLGLAAPARADTTAGLSEFQAGHFSEAYQNWRDAADRGDPVAALYLGVLYDTGFGVEQDYTQALDWYRRAGSAGSPTGMFNTAIMYDAGRGTAANPAEAARWYRRAARSGNGRAEYNLALMYDGGIGVRRDRTEAVRLYRSAARHGISAAREHLAELGVHEAAATGRPPADPAMTNFAEAQRLLMNRGTAEAARAVQLFRQSAEAGNPLAAYNLAYCYERGLGIQRDPQQAILWYRRAAETAGNTPVKQIAETGYRSLTATLPGDKR